MTDKTLSTIETVKQLVKTALRFARTLRNKKPKFLRVLMKILKITSIKIF